MLARIWHQMTKILRRYFVAGILTFAPIGITVWAIAWIVQRLDNLLLPQVLKLAFPGVQDPPTIPLLGALFTLLVILLFGVVARHLFGWELVRLWERVLSRVPVARNIYAAVKQLFEAIFRSESNQSFSGVAVIEYPRKGIFVLAFVTGPLRGVELPDLPPALASVFVPTTPNPTSGFYLLIPEEDLIPVDLTVEQAFKMVMSAGLVAPGNERGEPGEAAAGVPVAPPAGSYPAPGEASS
ncbi:MAG: hypothetical protein CL910_05785 [Deltaproteobacteria bacterium]|jgi:uncharacterized membrane protein|nr:hypothetical protein [Deltaproteobacteria bacterium]